MRGGPGFKEPPEGVIAIDNQPRPEAVSARHGNPQLFRHEGVHLPDMLRQAQGPEIIRPDHMRPCRRARMRTGAGIGRHVDHLIRRRIRNHRRRGQVTPGPVEILDSRIA